MSGELATEVAQSGVLLQTNPLSNLGNQIIRYIAGGVNDATTALIQVVIALVVGFVVAKFVSGKVKTLAMRLDLDGSVAGTWLGDLLGEGDTPAASALATFTKYFIYVIALAAALNAFSIPEVDAVMRVAALYAFQLVAGVFILMIGIALSGPISRIVADSKTAKQLPAPAIAGEVAKALVIAVTAIIALSAAGVSTILLSDLLLVVGLPLGLGIALAIGLAFGYGSQDYVRDHIDEWT